MNLAPVYASVIEVVLEYHVATPSHLVLNIEAARIESQTVVSETLSVEPAVAINAYSDQCSGNRLFRFDAQPGVLKIRHRATVQRLPVPMDLRQHYLRARQQRVEHDNA